MTEQLEKIAEKELIEFAKNHEKIV